MFGKRPEEQDGRCAFSMYQRSLTIKHCTIFFQQCIHVVSDLPFCTERSDSRKYTHVRHLLPFKFSQFAQTVQFFEIFRFYNR